ncbi:GTPase [Aeromonas enteropelogenes]|uniref:YcjF family protein n=1 Tax=Aeromonas enteropelogenes TaxID=29489 RepID=UPI002B2A317C|nr:GTPase [Aeromonas enteropelogenes]BEE22996.1 GTPase [Aeromonas enteropelogenes]
MASIEDRLEEQFDNEMAQVSRPNLMIVGGTGVGKSSLINLIFGKSIAKVGTGQPVTRGCERYEDPKVPLVIFDTEGYEVSEGKISAGNFREKIIPEIKQRKNKALNEQIHLIWYCLSVANHRITDFDLDNLRLITDQLDIPVAVVLTQCDAEPVDEQGNGETSQIFRQVLRENGMTCEVFETCANNPNHDPELKLDLEKLIDWSSTSLSNDSLRRSFVAAQIASLQAKRSEAMNIIMTYSATTAASAGFNPIPMSDALLIVPQQIAMAASLAKIYGIDSMGEIAVSMLKGQIISLMGRQLAASLTKLIPVLGQFINAGVAGVITGGLGLALVEVYERAIEGYLITGKAPDWTKLLSSELFMQAFNSGLANWKANKA